MLGRELPIATVAAVLADVVRGRPSDAGVFAGLRRERVEVTSSAEQWWRPWIRMISDRWRRTPPT
jgi:hypothetical protein